MKQSESINCKFLGKSASATDPYRAFFPKGRLSDQGLIKRTYLAALHCRRFEVTLGLNGVCVSLTVEDGVEHELAGQGAAHPGNFRPGHCVFTVIRS